MRAEHLQLSFTSGTDVQVARAGPSFFYGFLIGMDAANDPTITIYDVGTSTVAGSSAVVPSNSYDASALNLNGFTSPMRIHCSNGIAVECVLGAGACDVVILSSSRSIWNTG